MKKVIIYTDGACKGNPGPGGWAALLYSGMHEKKISGNEAHTTNNRMELTAPIKALQALKQKCHVELYTDSQYVQKGITLWYKNWLKKNWQTAGKKPVKNADLWQILIKLIEKHTINWHWVKGHSNHKENDLVDCLAKDAILQLLKKEKD